MKKRILIIGLLCSLINWWVLTEIGNRDEARVFDDDSVQQVYWAEKFYKNLKEFRNPFSYDEAVISPFGVSPAVSDLGFINGFFYIFLRPFITAHGAMQVLVLIGIISASVWMMVLLKKLGVDDNLAMIAGVGFGCAPFLPLRLLKGHYNYASHYLFPLVGLIVWKLTHDKKKKKWSVILGAVMAIAFYSNWHYFLMISLMLMVGIKYLVANIKHLTVAGLVFLLLSSPLIFEMCRGWLRGDWVGVNTEVSSVELSGGVFSIFVPSPLNPIGKLLNKGIVMASQPREGIIYPGILVLIALGLIKKIGVKNKRLLVGCFIGFWILSLGPFLDLKNVWSIPIRAPDNNGVFADGFIPMPFKVVSMIPGLSAVRSPIRFGIAMTFLGWIIFGLVMNNILKKSKKRKLLVGFMGAVMIMDGWYGSNMNLREFRQSMPLKAYEYIKKDGNKGVVMELPYTVGDGLDNWGEPGRSDIMWGQLWHGKPILGGYVGRIGRGKIDFYKQCRALSYYGQISSNTYKDWALLVDNPKERLFNQLNFLNVRYVLINTKKDRSEEIIGDFEKVGYEEIIDDGIWKLIVNNKLDDSEKLELLFGENDDWGCRTYGDWMLGKVGVLEQGGVGGMLFKIKDEGDYVVEVEGVLDGNTRLRVGERSLIGKQIGVGRWIYDLGKLDRGIISLELLPKKRAEIGIVRLAPKDGSNI